MISNIIMIPLILIGVGNGYLQGALGNAAIFDNYLNNGGELHVYTILNWAIFNIPAKSALALFLHITSKECGICELA